MYLTKNKQGANQICFSADSAADLEASARLKGFVVYTPITHNGPYQIFSEEFPQLNGNYDIVILGSYYVFCEDMGLCGN